jgi:hypothetical protein
MSRQEARTASYIKIYEDGNNEALYLLSNEANDTGGTRSSKDPVAITRRISFNQIQKRDKVAAEYMYTMACLFHQNIPKSLLLASTTRKAKETIAAF